MTATEELRRMLDERGVRWSPSAWDGSTETYWKSVDGNGCLAIQGETKLRLSFADYLTPAQAVEATLGGTCRVESVARNEYGYAPQVSDYTFELSCGHSVTWDEQPDYCPWCGRRLVE